jgi:hypothetical protein
MKKSLIISLLLITVMQLNAQNTAEKNSFGPRPDLSGDLTLSFGINLLNRNNVDALDLRPFGSNSFSIGYMYPIDIGNSNFTFNGGLNYSFDKYAFSEDSARTLVYYPATADGSPSRVDIEAIGSDIIGIGSVDKSKFETNYINIPLELRYYFDKSKKSNGFFIAAGASIGYLVTGKTSIKYTDNEQSKKIKRKESFELNQFRYGSHIRIGISGFGAFFQYDHSSLFNPGKGPENTSATPVRFGMSINLF